MKPLTVAIALALLSFTPAGAAEVNTLFSDIKPSGPGCGVGVEREGEMLFSKGFGLADLSAGVSVTPETRFYMASVSKQITAFTILRMEEAKKLRLKDPIRRYVPELPSIYDKVTLYSLLTHTSGVRDYFRIDKLDGVPATKSYTEATILELLKRQSHLNFRPGSDFLYSNSGYVLLAVAAERIEHRSFNEIARDLTFKPLGMNTSFFQAHHGTVVPELAHGYSSNNGKWEVDDSQLDVVGDGGLYSSVSDMVKWLENLDSRRVGPEAVAKMEKPVMTNRGEETGYGMGFYISKYRGLPLIEHSGGLVGYVTDDLWVPSRKFGAVVLCNSSDAEPERYNKQLVQFFLPNAVGLSEAAPLLKPSQDQLAAFSGRFESDGFIIEIAPAEGKLMIKGTPLEVHPISRWVAVVGKPEDGHLITFSHEQKALSIDSSFDGGPSTRFTRVEPIELSSSKRGAFAGDYKSTELLNTYHIKDGDDGLMLTVGDGKPMPMEVVGADHMIVKRLGADLVFDVGAGDKTKGFSISNDRIRGIEFQRLDHIQ